MSGPDTAHLTVFGWDLSHPPIPIQAALIPADVLVHAKAGGTVCFWVHPQPDGSILVDQFALLRR